MEKNIEFENFIDFLYERIEAEKRKNYLKVGIVILERLFREVQQNVRQYKAASQPTKFYLTDFFEKFQTLVEKYEEELSLELDEELMEGKLDLELVEKLKVKKLLLDTLLNQVYSKYMEDLQFEDVKDNIEAPQKENAVLAEIFKDGDFERYLDVFLTTNPPLLSKEGNKYTFIGNSKIHRGIIANFVYLLKSEGIVLPKYNRVELAKALTTSILNYKISPSNLEAISENFNKNFKPQLKEWIPKSCK